MREKIAFTADSDLIKRARARARKEKTTLGAVFREWLAQYTGNNTAADLMEELRHVRADRSFTRNEMNER